MKIGIYNPYLDTLGGGERYTLAIASYLSGSHTVSVFWDDKTILKLAQGRFHLNLKDVQVTQNIWKNVGMMEKISKSSKYDAIFFVSDGSIPISFAKKTYLIFQFPVEWVQSVSLWTQYKISRIRNYVCYSEFVKQSIDKTFHVNAKVIPPGVRKSLFAPAHKKNIILTVGRFTKGKNAKKHEILIDTFKKMCDEKLKGWSFIIAGGVLPKDADYVSELQKISHGYPIKIIPNISFDSLKKLYGEARIYWHAAGYGEDLLRFPERAEHFGITTVEAMSAGAVPVVFDGGGQSEIVRNGIDGYVWKQPEDLITQTFLLAVDMTKMQYMSQEAQKRAALYSENAFYEKIAQLIKGKL